MLTKALALAITILAFLACQLQAGIINSRWVGADLDQWSNTNSWDRRIVPNNNQYESFVVTISTTERTRILFTEDITISQLDCYGNVDLEVGEYWLQILDMNALPNKGILTNHGILQISGKGVEHEIYADIMNASGAQMFISNEVNFHGQFNNNGDIWVVPSGHLYCDGSLKNSGNFLIYNGHLEILYLENARTCIVNGYGVIHSNLSIINQGIIRAHGGSLLLHTFGPATNTGVLGNAVLSALHIQTTEDVSNFGRIEVNVGGGVAFDCNMVNEPNGVIKLQGGTLAATTITQKAGATFQGFGGITGNVVIEPNAVIKLTGPTNIVGDVIIEEGATLDISDGTVLIAGLTTCNGGTIQTFHGTFITQGGESSDPNSICRRIILD
jgi:hypothetical protein